MYWLENNLSQGGEDERTASQQGTPNSKKKGKAAALSSPNFLESGESSGSCSKKLSGSWRQFEDDKLGCGVDEVTAVGKSCLRKVSFAPCDQVEDGDPVFLGEAITGDDYDHDDNANNVDTSDAIGDVNNYIEDTESSTELDADSDEISSHSTLGEETSADRVGAAIEGAGLEENVSDVAEEESESPLDSPKESQNDRPTGNCLYFLGPKLPRRNYPPPSPPPDTSHYTRSSASSQPHHHHLLTRKTQSEDDYLSYHIKKKLLALKLKEKAEKEKVRSRLVGVSSTNSSTSNTGTRRKVGGKHGGHSRPLFSSTNDSDLTDESNPTVYYTPKQSLEFQKREPSREFTEDEMPVVTSSLDYEDAIQDPKPGGSSDTNGHIKTKASSSSASSSQRSDLEGSEGTYSGILKRFHRKDSKESQSSKSSSSTESASVGSTQLSMCSSSSAPSFLIGSSTQLCQCIGEKSDSNDKFKALLDRICDGNVETDEPVRPATPVEGSQPSTPHLREASEVFEDAKNTPEGRRLCTVDESWWRKIEESCSASEEPVDEVEASEAKSLDILSDFEKALDSPVVEYRKIELDELLNRLYPDSNSLHHVNESDYERSISPSAAQVAQTESEMIPSDFVIQDNELGDLVELLGESSEPSEANATTYEQAEMSLEVCNEDLEEIESSVKGLLQPPLLPTPGSQSGHISIEIPDDFGTVDRSDEAKDNASGGSSPDDSPGKTTKCFGEECFAPLSSCLCTNILGELGLEIEESKTKSDDLQGGGEQPWPSLSTDLIDINYDPDVEQISSTPKQKILEQNDSITVTSLDSNSDWQDISLRYPQEGNEGGARMKTEAVYLPNTSHEYTDTSLDSSCLSTHQHLMLSMKKELPATANQTNQSATPDSKNSSLMMESLCSATDILEKSHNCLAKSVHSLRQRAIIKQSNISLELVLPSDNRDSEEEQSCCCISCFQRPSAVVQQPKQSALNVELNSSIVYPPAEIKQTTPPPKTKQD